jgi:hypothetical protein
MLRATRIATTLAALCGALSVCMCTPALAAAHRGTLTGTEYRQLSAATAALNRSAGSKAINWAKARAACRLMRGSGALLHTQRISCLDSISTLEALANFPSEQARCAASATGTTTTGTTTTGTTTTGTTTTADQSAVIRAIICLNPRYQALDRYAKAIYASDAAARKQALARGFRGKCLATLASTPADLKKERSFASSAARLAADVKVLIKVTKGQAPPSDLNQIQTDNDVARFESTARAVLAETGPQKLSACPRQ